METRRLEAFVALVDKGGFRQAADELFITQPALSQQIARLEKDVNVKLIDRTTRPVTVTGAGREFYFRCRNVLDAMNDISRLLVEAKDAQFGRVRIGIVPAMLFAPPTRAVRTFQEHFPEVEVSIRSIFTSSLIEELEQGTIDVAILLIRPDLKDLSTVDLYSEDYVVCLPNGHSLSQKDEVSFAQLRNERFLQGTRSANPVGFDSIVAACMSAGYSPNSLEVMGSYLDHAGLVSAGMGVSFAPTSFAYLRPNGVEYRKLVEPTPNMTVSISWYQRRLDSAGQTFVKHCISECATDV